MYKWKIQILSPMHEILPMFSMPLYWNYVHKGSREREREWDRSERDREKERDRKHACTDRNNNKGCIQSVLPCHACRYNAFYLLQLDNQTNIYVFPTVLAPIPPPKSVASDSGQWPNYWDFCSWGKIELILFFS